MTATVATRNPLTGRFTRRPDPRCDTCGWTLAENLLGQLVCVKPRCEQYRVVAGVVAGVDVGGLDERCLAGAR